MYLQSVLLKKIDLFMKNHIVNTFDPSDIYWWFSMSGGKDSFAMCHGVYTWYCINGFKFQGSAFTIKQWNNNVFDTLKNQLNWIELIEIDATEETKKETKYQKGRQAPCAICSNVRKNVGDNYIKLKRKQAKVNIIARGLHLSDTAISYLWRWAFYDDLDASILKKYQPITQILTDIFLAKPLCYVRERESQEYAHYLNFKPACCGCPACKFPSRRDIVEESLLDLYKDLQIDKWEFYVPGMQRYLRHHLFNQVEYLKNISVQGFAKKKNHIKETFYDFAIQYFRNKINFNSALLAKFDHSSTLDDFAKESLLLGKKQMLTGEILIPKFFSEDYFISNFDRKMIATMGPFWGGIGALKPDRVKILQTQKEILGYSINEKWMQVNDMINEYYSKGETNEKEFRLDKCSICCDCNN